MKIDESNDVFLVGEITNIIIRKGRIDVFYGNDHVEYEMPLYVWIFKESGVFIIGKHNQDNIVLSVHISRVSHIKFEQ